MKQRYRLANSAMAFTIAALVYAVLGIGCAEDTNPYFTPHPRPQHPDYTDEGYVVPEGAPEASLCSDNGWCWLHPSPSPTGITDLRAVDGEILGIGRIPGKSGHSPMVWGDPLEVVDPPVPEAQSVSRVATSANGWLALTENNTLYEFDRDGVIGTAEFPDRTYRRIEGHSVDLLFGLYDDEESGYLLRDGNITKYPSLPRPYRSKVHLWSDGTVWEVSNDAEEARSLEESWRRFPRPEFEYTLNIDVLGPDPTSKCADAGIWTMGNRHAWRWNDTNDRWKQMASDFPTGEGFGCSADGRAAVVDRRGGLNTLRGGHWQRKNIDPFRLDEITSTQTTTYASGRFGSMVEVTGDNVRDLTRGFRLPPDPDEFVVKGFTDLWFSRDGNRGVLTHKLHFYHGGPEGWRTRPHSYVSSSSRGFWDKVWGIRHPEFAIKRGALYRWAGSRWETTRAGPFEDHRGPRDISGRSTDDVWVITPDRVLQYDGDSWIDAVEPPSVGSKHSALHVESEGEVTIAAGSKVYRVAGSAGSRSLEELFVSPCDVIYDMYRSETGALYVAGEDNCVARRDSEGWTEYQVSWGDTETDTDPKQVEFVDQPGQGPPLIAAETGLYALFDSGQSDQILKEHLLDATYVPDKNAVVVLAKQGVLAKYY